MNKQEFAKYAMALKTFYPKEKILQTDQAMELWYHQLKDIPYDIAQGSLLKWVKENKYSPGIAEIIAEAEEYQKTEMLRILIAKIEGGSHEKLGINSNHSGIGNSGNGK